VIGQNRFPGLDDKPNLHYTNAVLHESLRAASLVPTGVPHYTSDDVSVGSYIIPKGTVVFGSLYHIMNDPQHFKDPHTFNPDRFLNANGKFVLDERVTPFGVGKRICLGQTLAEKEFYIFLTGLMQQFKVTKDDNYPPPSYNFNDVFPKALLRTIPSFKLKLTNRFKA
jgi:cytochrome P450